MSSFLFPQRKQSSAERVAVAVAEIELMTDMFNRVGRSCAKKCIPTNYHEEDLNKGESVCLDRCVSKYMETNIKVSELMQAKQGQARLGM